MGSGNAALVRDPGGRNLRYPRSQLVSARTGNCVRRRASMRIGSNDLPALGTELGRRGASAGIDSQ